LDNSTSIVEKDVRGQYHFNGNFKNAGDLKNALEKIDNADYKDLVNNDATQLINIFEKVFNHKAFTGRSGTFYGYEGLGSIYWHMVSKLLLAVQESALAAERTHESQEVIGRLLEHYYEIQAGIGVHKSPELFGAFPTDPYSHTPMHKGAQQPGMTGQVKEDLLSRYGELGIIIEKGYLKFSPVLLRKTEFLTESKTIHFTNLKGDVQSIELKSDQLFFTYCQVPVVYELGDKSFVEIIYFNGKTVKNDSESLNKSESDSIFGRKGEIESLKVTVNREILK
jgi:hypothetical protein